MVFFPCFSPPIMLLFNNMDFILIRINSFTQIIGLFIASSVKIHKCKLITQDEDFKKIKEIEVKSIDKI